MGFLNLPTWICCMPLIDSDESLIYNKATCYQTDNKQQPTLLYMGKFKVVVGTMAYHIQPALHRRPIF